MRLHFPVAGLCALVLAWTLAGTAHADEKTPDSTIGVDIVSLKNGGMLRGTVIAVEPDKQVIIVVGGEQRIVPWADVARVDQGKETPPPQTITSSPAPLTTPTVGRGSPFIHIESDWQDVQLGRIDTEALFSTSSRNFGSAVAGGLVRPVCRAPCDRVIDGREGGRFVFISSGMVPSDPFFLDDKNGRLVAHVNGGSIGKRFGGLLLATLGGLMTLGGTALVGVALSPDIRAASGTTPVGMAGAIMFGLGAAQLVPGILLLAFSGTHVEFTSDRGVAIGRLRFEGGRMLF